MKKTFFKSPLALLTLALAVGCTHTKKADTDTVTASQTSIKTDTVYPQFPGGIQALNQQLKDYEKTLIILEVDEKGNTTYANYGTKRVKSEKGVAEKVKSLPAWKPGTLNGKPGRFCFVYSASEKQPIFKCINAGCLTEKHKLQQAWKLIDTNGEAIKMHPIYKEGNNVSLSFNHFNNLLHKVDDNEANFLHSQISNIKNKFAVRYDEKTIVIYRYRLNTTNDTLITRYTDDNGKEQTLRWANITDSEEDWQEKKVVPPPLQAKQITEILEIVEDDAEIEESEIMSVEDQGEIMSIEELGKGTENNNEETIHLIAEQQPQFPGGMQALMKYLRESIEYPAKSRDNNSQGKTYVNFVVNTDGSIQDIEVMKSSGDVNLDNEAVRVVKNMPKWAPGKVKGEDVRVRFTLPITFRLQ